MTYIPRGAAYSAYHSTVPEMVLSGPAGTGKSRCLLEKMHAVATWTPNFRGLMLRKTRASLTDSALVTFENLVVEPGHSCMAGASRQNRHSYRYPNGSEIVVGGLDKASRIMSTEFDIIFIQEAIEVSEDDWLQLKTRLERREVLPFTQILADTNPSYPQHWLKVRCDSGRAKMLQSRHVDNPLLWDSVADDWTEIGRRYMVNLDGLTGVWRDRLRDGKWVQAEGAVYPEWHETRNVVDRFEPSRWWTYFLSVDFGYVNPFVCQAWFVDGDGRMILWKEWCKTNMLVEDHAKIIKAEFLDPIFQEPAFIVTDHDSEDRATLERHLGRATRPAIKAVSEGLQAMAARIRLAGDGKPRLMVMRDALIERDPGLASRRLPCGLVEEIQSYVWSMKTVAGGPLKDAPVKLNDHSVDSARYACAALESNVAWWESPADIGDRLAINPPRGVFDH